MSGIKIGHLAVWTADLERLKDFYSLYFGASPGKKYKNPATGFESYFLVFSSGARLELMSAPGLSSSAPGGKRCGLAHLAFSLGSRAAVTDLNGKLSCAGFTVASGPRVTGDGYFESVVLDPDGNLVELTE